MSESPERFFVSEIIRKHIFLQYHQEVPYSVAGRWGGGGEGGGQCSCMLPELIAWWNNDALGWHDSMRMNAVPACSGGDIVQGAP